MERLYALERSFVPSPDSLAIAEELTRVNAEACEHGKLSCYPACGVALTERGWRTLPHEHRLAWLATVRATRPPRVYTERQALDLWGTRPSCWPRRAFDARGCLSADALELLARTLAVLGRRYLVVSDLCASALPALALSALRGHRAAETLAATGVTF